MAVVSAAGMNIVLSMTSGAWVWSRRSDVNIRQVPLSAPRAWRWLLQSVVTITKHGCRHGDAWLLSRQSMVNMVKYGISTAVCGGGRDGYRQVGCRHHKRCALLKIVGWFTSVLAGTIW